MSADVLREAAALMRERAKSAAEGPWTSGPHFSRSNCASVFAGRRSDAHYLAMYATTGNAEHIASWHPVVALAVADLLDAVIEHVDSYDCEAHCEPGGCLTVLRAWTLARTYLGAVA